MSPRRLVMPVLLSLAASAPALAQAPPDTSLSPDGETQRRINQEINDKLEEYKRTWRRGDPSRAMPAVTRPAPAAPLPAYRMPAKAEPKRPPTRAELDERFEGLTRGRQRNGLRGGPPRTAPAPAAASGGTVHVEPGIGDGFADADAAEAEAVVLNEGRYQGVTLGGESLPPAARRAGKGRQRLTWSGFQVKDDVPTVFLQTTATPSYRIEERGAEIVVHLHRTSVPVKNNLRPLDLEAFGTTVRRVEVRPRGHDVEVHIATRAAGQAHQARVEPAAGGFQFLVIALPK